MGETISISWKSYLIREKGVTVFDDYIAAHFKRANDQEESITFNTWTSGPYPTWGMPALCASKAAALQGKQKWQGFHLSIMKAFYTDGRDISDKQVLIEIASEVGLNMAAFTREFNDPKWEMLVYEETKTAQELYGIHSIPAVIIQGQYLIEGAVSLDQYKNAIEGKG